MDEGIFTCKYIYFRYSALWMNEIFNTNDCFIFYNQTNGLATQYSKYLGQVNVNLFPHGKGQLHNFID